jgi:hypothetical protein
MQKVVLCSIEALACHCATVLGAAGMWRDDVLWRRR